MHTTILGLLLALLVPAAAAAPIATGGTLTSFEIADQYEHQGEVDAQTRLVLLGRDMKANKIAKRAFGGKPATYLSDAGVMYLIDVSGMPGFVTEHFAIPKMRKYPYRVFLDHEGTLTAMLPSEKAKLTLVHLDHLKVTAIEYLSDADALLRAVDNAAR